MIQFRDVAWRAMSGYDIDAVSTIAGKVHPGFYESVEVLAEKYALYHNGCYLLEVNEKPAGYVLSHPWRLGDLPPLNTLLGALPETPDTYYIHDLALLPLTRGLGSAKGIVAALTKHAAVKNFATMSLVAVNKSRPFWEKLGFEVEERPDLVEKLHGYEADACYMIKRLP